jgi:predicted nuclease with TOPRIM domain
MPFEVPRSFLANSGIVKEDIPGSLKSLDCKGLKLVIRDFHPDKVQLNEVIRNKCHYLNELLNSKKILEQLERRHVDATQKNEECEDRIRRAQNKIDHLRSMDEDTNEIENTNGNEVQNIVTSEVSQAGDTYNVSYYCRMRHKPRGRPRKGFKWTGEKEWGSYRPV